MAAAVVRPAAVAGTFYPGNPGVLRAAVEGYLAEGRAGLAGGEAAPRAARVSRSPKAVIAPHAGYVYSGPTAGYAFAALTAGEPALRRIVLLGPAHRVWLRGLGLPGAEGFATPLGVVPVDGAAVEAVSDLPQVSIQPLAHAPEHSLEVELPFLQVAQEGVAIVPLVVGEASGEEVAEVLERLWGGPETAIVVSSDLSHFLPYDKARRVDRDTADEILALRGPLHPRQACGALAVNGLLTAARRLGLVAELLDLRSSGDTAGAAGDRDQVVGYGAFAFHEEAGPASR
jgi:MEMO1 family protein